MSKEITVLQFEQKNQNICRQIKNLAITADISYIDAVIEYGLQNNIELETLAEIIKQNDQIVEAIKDEALDLRMLNIEKEPKLPYI